MEETFRERCIWIDDVGRVSWHGGERMGGGRDGRSGRGRGAISSRAIDDDDETMLLTGPSTHRPSLIAHL